MTRKEMAKTILDFEARRDAQGHLKVYHLPANDGGGSYEVAGINERYHPAVAEKLMRLIEKGQFTEAEELAVEHIADYTDTVKDWQSDPAIELFLRDSCFNRGPAGAAKILQLAVGVKADGKVGPITRGAVAPYTGHTILFLARLRAARERYEDIVAPNRPNLRLGLENRWDNVFEVALGVEQERRMV